MSIPAGATVAIVGRAGAELAFPSQTIYTGNASEIDTTKAEDARKTVQQRQQAGTLCVPEIPDEVAEQIRASATASDSTS